MEDLERLLAPRKAAILERMLRGATLEDVLGEIVSLVEEHSPDPVAGSVLLLDEQRGSLTLGAAPHLDMEYNAAVDGIEIGPRAGTCGTAAYRGETVVVADIASDPLWERHREIALAHGLKSCWSVPIKGADNTVLGTFAMYSRSVRAPTHYEFELLDAASALAAVAIERQQAQETREALALEHARTQSLSEEGSLLRRLVASLPAMIVVTHGPTHIVDIANSRFATATGLAEAAIVERPLAEILHCLEPRRFSAILEKVYRLGQPFTRKEMRLTLQQHDGGYLNAFVDFRCEPIERDGVPVGLFIQAIDVTAPVNAREELRRLQQVKDDFLVSLAHDLRNPAMVMAGNASIMLRALDQGHLDAAVFRECLDSIAVTAHRLGLRSRELTDLVRVEAGQPSQVLLEPVDLVPLVRRVLADFARAGDTHPMTIDCPEETLIGEWDASRIEALLVNLVGNALKYSADVEPVEVRLRRQGNLARIDVVDRGIGLNEEELSKLFSRYWRSERVSGSPGTGVGLMSAKHTVELHGGSITAQSRRGEGSTFTVMLPL